MPQYIGFSTINAREPRGTGDLGVTSTGETSSLDRLSKKLQPGKKFRLLDEQLVIRDFLNALNIRQGEKVGQPDYGTTLWSFVFEPNTSDVQFKLQDEIRRVASLDPRLDLNEVRAFPSENGILIEIQVAIVPFNVPESINIFFDSDTNVASLV